MPHLRAEGIFGLVLALILLTASATVTRDDVATYRDWVLEMKASERGPFSRIRWFCNDGAVLPPEAYACEPHGGGHQHGEWSERTKSLRTQGYFVANLLAGVDVDALLSEEQFLDRYAQLLIERFLVGADDGWILRQALFYRGAIQEEDERRGARDLLNAMAARQEWIGPRFAALRAGVRLLRHGADSASVQRVRQLSASLSDRDETFSSLRAKIHGAPSAEDASRVRDYAAGLDEARREPYLELADEIDRVYRAAPLDEKLVSLAQKYTAAPWLQKLLSDAASALRENGSAASRFEVTGELLADLRDALPRIHSPEARLEVLDLGLSVEAANFGASAELRSTLDAATRARHVSLLGVASRAAYGTGLVNARLLDELDEALNYLGPDSIGLNRYLEELNYLGRAPGWATQALRMHFFESMEKLAEIEPMAMLFIQDQLRGSPLLFYSQVLDRLSRDASRLAGVEHRLFGEAVGVGFAALNPGLAAGMLRAEPDLSDLERLRTDGIYVLPETVSDLPPIAGILTQGEGNPLSHVQLLARNLGIPNVTVDASLAPTLRAHDGERTVMAVSKSGLVEIARWDDRWAAVFEEANANGPVRIEPDLDKLDLSVRRFLSLEELRASDSGRVVGPKAAKLGELRAHYPGMVSRGIAIPFGLFRQEALDQAHAGGGTVFEWMVRNYRELEAIPVSDPRHAEEAEAFRAELYDIVAGTVPGTAFQNQLKAAMEVVFGSDNPPGVFVRSDTNVEDLAGFTGAGLNLTLPNVVGYDNLLRSIARVWASPFTARALAWRQSHMTQPENVYTSILLLESVASDKSGVLITQDIDTGNPGVISVAANEGLGGAVDGQAAESLRIPLDGSHVHVLATATAPWRRAPAAAGGLRLLPTSGSDTVLQPGEIDQLIAFVKGLPAKFPPITDEDGNPAPADVEFGFLDGQLRLFQLRPFLESRQARGIEYLHQMEARLAEGAGVMVSMNQVPE
jgi:hypothetical protein